MAIYTLKSTIVLALNKAQSSLAKCLLFQLFDRKRHPLEIYFLTVPRRVIALNNGRT